MTSGAPGEATCVAHASCVAVAGRAVLITGPSGSGKSGLALRLMALGAHLVADDLVALSRRGDRVCAQLPSGAPGLVEARGVGLIATPTYGEAEVALVVDLARRETNRLPPIRRTPLLGLQLPLVFGGEALNLAAAVMVLLRHGRLADPEMGVAEPRLEANEIAE